MISSASSVPGTAVPGAAVPATPYAVAPVVPAAAALAAPGTLACYASTTLDDLWAAYISASEAAQAAWQVVRMTRAAGGTDGTAGFSFGRAYQLQTAVEAAYETWRLAQARAFSGVRG